MSFANFHRGIPQALHARVEATFACPPGRLPLQAMCERDHDTVSDIVCRTVTVDCQYGGYAARSLVQLALDTMLSDNGQLVESDEDRLHYVQAGYLESLLRTLLHQVAEGVGTVGGTVGTLVGIVPASLAWLYPKKGIVAFLWPERGAAFADPEQFKRDVRARAARGENGLLIKTEFYDAATVFRRMGPDFHRWIVRQLDWCLGDGLISPGISLLRVITGVVAAALGIVGWAVGIAVGLGDAAIQTVHHVVPLAFRGVARWVGGAGASLPPRAPDGTPEPV